MKNINLAYYRKEEWGKFLSIIDDRHAMHHTWDEWHKAYQKTKQSLISKGFDVVDFTIDLDELVRYCFMNGLKNTGETRSKFISNR